MKDVLQALTSNLELMRMRPGTLCPEMDEVSELNGLETLVDLVTIVDVSRLAPEMRKTAAAVVEHLPFAASQLAAVLSQPGQAAAGSSHAANQLSHCLQVCTNDSNDANDSNSHVKLMKWFQRHISTIFAKYQQGQVEPASARLCN